MKRLTIITLLLLSVTMLLAACGETDSNTDAASVQNLFPELNGYGVQETESIQDAFSVALAGAGVASGAGVAALPVIERIDSVIDCYREVGAVDAKIYIAEQQSALLTPSAGVLAIVNQDRVVNNFINCVADVPLFNAQEAGPTICSRSGSFMYEGDTINYLYATTDSRLCSLFDNHFAPYTSG